MTGGDERSGAISFRAVALDSSALLTPVALERLGLG
jgi:hypothetical protein